jgi:hypothetical protein
VCNLCCFCKTKYIFYWKQTYLGFNKLHTLRTKLIPFVRMSRVQQKLLCSTRYTAQCALPVCIHFHTRANLCVYIIRINRIFVFCCPYLQNSLSDGNGTAQNEICVPGNAISFRHMFLLYLCKTICVSTPINRINLCRVHIYYIWWKIINI